jgi:hypothetical protein
LEETGPGLIETPKFEKVNSSTGPIDDEVKFLALAKLSKV